MIYLDTSVIVPWFVAETTSTRACRWRDELSATERSEFAISSWAVTEFTSAMGLKVRASELTRGDADEILAQFHSAVLPHFTRIEPEATDFRLAETLLREFSLGLRSGDSLHLATAVRTSARVFATFDLKLRAAATRVGVDLARM